MLCREIVSKIEEKYPVDAAMEWDNVGLLVGRTSKEVKRIYVALDLTEDIIAKAKEVDADMIVTHHPMIFSPENRITDESMTGRRIVELLQSDICCYAAHTNYDVLRMGEMASDKMGLKNTEDLDEGIGKIGDLDKEYSLAEICKQVKKQFSLPSVKVFGPMEQKISRVAILPGSGKSAIDVAVEKRADVLITGDVDHHHGIDAVAEGLAIIDAGHYGLEHIFIRDMAEFVKSFGSVEVIEAPIEFPFVNV